MIFSSQRHQNPGFNMSSETKQHRSFVPPESSDVMFKMEPAIDTKKEQDQIARKKLEFKEQEVAQGVVASMQSNQDNRVIRDFNPELEQQEKKDAKQQPVCPASTIPPPNEVFKMEKGEKKEMRASDQQMTEVSRKEKER